MSLTPAITPRSTSLWSAAAGRRAPQLSQYPSAPTLVPPHEAHPGGGGVDTPYAALAADSAAGEPSGAFAVSAPPPFDAIRPPAAGPPGCARSCPQASQ